LFVYSLKLYKCSYSKERIVFPLEHFKALTKCHRYKAVKSLRNVIFCDLHGQKQETCERTQLPSLQSPRSWQLKHLIHHGMFGLQATGKIPREDLDVVAY
jgi:hypothetical protein